MFDEQELIVRCKEGDVPAFEMLIEGYQKKVINAAYAMMGNMEDAYDVAQEIFLKVFSNIDKFNQQSSFSTWLYKVTHNMCLDEIRRRKRRDVHVVSLTQEYDEETHDLQIADIAPQPDELAERSELQNHIRRSIQELPQDYRAAIIMREIEDMDYQQISDVLGCSLGTVKSRISRARKMLQEKILQYEELL